MKTAVLAAAVVSIAAASIIPVHAGDREWSTAGKVLTGVFAAGVIAEAFRPHCPPPVFYAPSPVMYAPAPVVYAPAPVVYAPAPVVYYAAPAPQVVYVAAPPVCYAPAPFYRPHHMHVHFGGRW
ncbi:MAG: hypothetical protein WCP53_02890 [Verrucomicrobiota bacterium]